MPSTNPRKKKITREQLSSMNIENVIEFYGDNPIDPERAANALKIIHTDCKKAKSLGFGNPLGNGGFKQVYEYTKKPGYVIAIRNMSVDMPEEQMAKRWCEAVYEEKVMSDLCLDAGLRAQNFEIIKLKVDGFEVPALIMPSFELLNSRGQQVRDLKNAASSCGRSFIYGQKENLTAVYLRELFDYVINDIVTLMVNGIPVDGDTSNLMIEDTKKSRAFDPMEWGHFMDRKQIIKLYLFDFSNKYSSIFPLKKVELIGDDGQPNHNLITKMALSYFNKAYYMLAEGVTDVELIKLTGNFILGLSLVLERKKNEIEADVVREIVDLTLEKLKNMNIKTEEKFDDEHYYSEALNVTVQNLKSSIGNMKAYGTELKNNGASKGGMIIALSEQLDLKLTTFLNGKDYSYKKVRQFKQEFDVLLNSRNEEMKHYRLAWGTIIKNIALALIPVLGLLAIAGQLLYSKATKGRALFFGQKERTTTEDKALEIHASLKSIRGFPPM